MKTVFIFIFLLCAGKLFPQVSLNCDGLQQILNALHNGSIKGAEKYGSTSSASDKYKILESKLTVSGQSNAFIFISYYSDFPDVSADFTVFTGTKKEAEAKWQELSSLIKSCIWSGWREDIKNKNYYSIETGESGKPGNKRVSVAYSKQKSKPGKPWAVYIHFDEIFSSLSGY